MLVAVTDPQMQEHLLHCVHLPLLYTDHIYTLNDTVHQNDTVQQNTTVQPSTELHCIVLHSSALTYTLN